ncbi:phosphatidylinositol-specific phospholipase C/glycerophosphodiester phosphodiesterase family protein [Streptomyces sp. NPDC048639]|uniref:phosphatidylinositol-specific phospholipase C/glycerophosphodiester phosphodiesterase family protein n=1 Tax=Streptomyces sp. NPDC048639 TaxID=3365581 RepID=UPI003712CBF8
MCLPSRRSVVATLGATVVGGLAAPALAWASGPTAHRPEPLRRAHAHNDYEHPRPLADALTHRFTSVEADIWLIDGHLLVGHDLDDLSPDRTLESLYLEPLLARVRANHGWVYRGHRVPLQLLVDIKNTGEATYLELHRVLRRYRSMLSFAAGGTVGTRAVTPVVSGDRAARAPMEAQQLRYAFYDGRLDDLGTGVPASFIPLVSSNWTQSFTWQGEGAMPAEERATLHAIVSAAHAERQRVRFWGTPDLAGPARTAVWRELLDAGADHINTDDLAGLERFLSAHDSAGW